MTAQIQELPERYCYRVPSHSKQGKFYDVDLTANGGAGWCPCRDHQTRRQPALDRGMPPLTKYTLCRHLTAAYWHLLKGIMPMLAEQESEAPSRFRNT